MFGLFAPSDHRFGRFISPMTNPVFFEDPRTLTEARFVFFHHVIPQDVGGGTAQLMAMQVRAALTERLSIVAAKDGFVTSSHPLVDDGWADVYVGLKYNLLADPCFQRLVSVGASYELPVGSRQTFQANGDGEFHIYLTGGTQIGCLSHWISGTGVRLPVDRNDNSQMWYWSNHFDRQLFGCLYGLAEVNWYHWFGSGANGLDGVEGLDIINFGSTNVAGNNIVTGAVGVKLKPSDGMEIGVAWEAPLTDRRDILDNRLTVDWIVRY
ncbi:MAG: hypothetical protein J5I93_17115 [Pirellulaceae bacterium]|nr:hypothetical protein [Pirellulaceae bacterium]